MKHSPSLLTARSDSELVALSTEGERNAFGQLVDRYATLACSVAYSACGNFEQSRDLAQDSFVAAWRQLTQLREPAKFRVWLCGIVRQMALNRRRRLRNEPVVGAESLDDVSELAAVEPTPDVETISREQSTLVWAALEKMPEQFREPLVLFYREGHSVERVAEALDLSVDTVKQRLSRGRVALREELAVVVAETLLRSRPGAAFSVAVLAALPAFVVPKASAAAAVSAGAGAVGKAGLFSGPWLALLGGPALALIGGYAGYRLSLLTARSDEERELLRRYMVRQAVGTVLLVLLFAGLLLWPMERELRVRLLAWLVPIATTAMIVDSLSRALRLQSRLRALREKVDSAAAANGLPRKTSGELRWRSSISFLGLPLWEIALDSGFGGGKPAIARAWFAFGSIAYGAIFAVGGVAVGGVAIGGLAIGAVSIGGMAVGVIAVGGFAAGVYAVGGIALGWLALGGASFAWHFAAGGVAWAREVAVGGHALAMHANDEFAHAVAERWATTGRALQWLTIAIPLAVCAVIACVWRPLARRLTERNAAGLPKP